MSKVVLDASAILAFIFDEPGAERLTPALLRSAVASTVNLAEVQSKLVNWGHPPDEAWEDALATVAEVEQYTSEQAKIAGSLVTETKTKGLSLGDRSCLALALLLDAPVYTTEQIWRNIKVGVKIHVIR
jgi:ribonuclease VapC